MFGNGLWNASSHVRAALVIGLMCSGSTCAHAATAYRCRGADGAVAFQDRPCAAAQRETLVELAPEPPPAPSPDYGIAPPRHAAAKHAPSRPSTRRQATSSECRSDDGEVFYRHGACPKSIRSGHGTGTAAVGTVELPRVEACRRIAAAGSVGRRGRDRDDRVSTYERNAGRDPCRAE